VGAKLNRRSTRNEDLPKRLGTVKKREQKKKRKRRGKKEQKKKKGKIMGSMRQFGSQKGGKKTEGKRINLISEKSERKSFRLGGNLVEGGERKQRSEGRGGNKPSKSTQG